MIELTENSARSYLAIFFVIICVYFAHEKEHRAPVPDGYSEYAYSLSDWGQYARARPDAGPVAPPPEIGLAPLYSTFLSAAMVLSPSYRAMVECHVERLGNCNWRDARLVHVLQVLMIVAALFLMMKSATMIGAPVWAAGIITALSLIHI